MGTGFLQNSPLVRLSLATDQLTNPSKDNNTYPTEDPFAIVNYPIHAPPCQGWIVLYS